MVDVLLIEDNDDDIELARRVFEKLGVAGGVHVVRDGVETLDFLFGPGSKAGPPERPPVKLILLDLNLPRVSGLEVLRQLKSNDRMRSIPVIVLTVSKEEPDLLQCFTMGITDYIVKPIELDRFAALYKTHVNA